MLDPESYYEPHHAGQDKCNLVDEFTNHVDIIFDWSNGKFSAKKDGSPLSPVDKWIAKVLNSGNYRGVRFTHKCWKQLLNYINPDNTGH